MPEPPWHGDSVQVEVSGRQSPDEGSKVCPEHREVAGEDLAEALVELSLNESNEGCRYALLDLCLCSEEVVYLVCLFQECCELKHCWVANKVNYLLRAQTEVQQGIPASLV